MQQVDVIIIGAGASGLMCAALAAKRGRKVLVVEKAKQPGRKILMSGGGRCNFTNREIAAKNYISDNPHFCKSALNRYTNWDFLAKIYEYEVAHHERDLGKLFCDDSARPILDMLLAECRKTGAELKMQVDVRSIKAQDNGFIVSSDKGIWQAESVVIATGGLSIPSMGSSGFAYQIAEQFQLKTLPRRAGLVPFTFSDDIKNLCEALSGIALDCHVQVADDKNNAPSFSEAMLFTHRGLSGPAILQLSNYWQTGQEIIINLLPNEDLSEQLLSRKKQGSQQQLNTALHSYLPKKLVQELAQRYWPELQYQPLVNIKDQQLQSVAQQIQAWRVKPSGTEGYRTAEVTLGGVCTSELSSKTLEANKQKGLYFIGEAVDVTGWLGGYNFQWAWSSAAAAAAFV